MITARGTKKEMDDLLSKINAEENYPNTTTYTTQYSEVVENDGEYVLLLEDSDETRAKKYHKGKIDKGNTKKKDPMNY